MLWINTTWTHRNHFCNHQHSVTQYYNTATHDQQSVAHIIGTILQQHSTHCNTPQHTAKQLNPLHHIINALQHVSTNCNTHHYKLYCINNPPTETHINIFCNAHSMHTAILCNAPQHTAAHCSQITSPHDIYTYTYILHMYASSYIYTYVFFSKYANFLTSSHECIALQYIAMCCDVFKVCSNCSKKPHSPGGFPIYNVP